MPQPERPSLSDQGAPTDAQVWESAAMAASVEVDRLKKALEKIDRLAVKWGAPLAHSPGDYGEAKWAAVGSEASLIAHRALGGSLESARARLTSGATEQHQPEGTTDAG